MPISILACVVVGCFWTATASGRARTVTVAADGSGDFKSVQAAIDSIPAKNEEPAVIHIGAGRYKEKICLPRDKRFVAIRGDDAGTTVLTYDQNAASLGADGKPLGTSGSYSTWVDADDFLAENITFENTAGDVGGRTGQALALKASGDRQVYRKCRFLGWQDTLYADGGRQYYADCYIEGRVDFIFGSATAVFDRCELHSKNGGYVTAASTPREKPFGYVFLHCKLTGEGGKAMLGRPWRPYAAVTFAFCEIGDHIKPAGWDNWRNTENEKTARYAEYKCTGPGAERGGRVTWSHELTDEEGTKLTVANILGGEDKWEKSAGRSDP
jgi:pectinesterase